MPNFRATETQSPDRNSAFGIRHSTSPRFRLESPAGSSMDERMHFLAAAQSSTTRLGEVPAEFWVKLALGIAVLIGVVIVLRKLAKVNKVVLGVIIALILTFIGFNWIYERNEPAWATPVVQWLANYFPSKGAIKKTSMVDRGAAVSPPPKSKVHHASVARSKPTAWESEQ
jgi:hypothetical protein